MYKTILQIKQGMDLSPITIYTSFPSARWYFQDPSDQRDKAKDVWIRGSTESRAQFDDSFQVQKYSKTLVPKSKTSTRRLQC